MAMKTESFSVYGMVCYSCAGILETAVKSVPGVAGVQANYLLDTVKIQFEETTVDTGTLYRAALKAGYRLVERSGNGQEAAKRDKRMRRQRKRELRNRIFLSFCCSLLLNAYQNVLPVWLQLLAASAVQLLVIREFYKDAGNGAVSRKGNMSLLIAVGTTLGYCYSIYALLPNGDPRLRPCFDNVAAIVTMVLIGRFIELGTRMESTEHIRRLFGRRVQQANMVTQNGIKTVSISEVHAGSRLLVRGGERVPVDGKIVDGKLCVDESVMTGEYFPVEKGPGDALTGGSHAVKGSAVYQANREPEESLWYRLLEDASNAMLGRKLSLIRYVDRIMEYFVPLVLFLGIATLFLWYGVWAPGDLHKAMSCSLAVFLTACPCAMSLAVPLSVVHTVGGAAKQGIFIREEGKLEKLGKVKRVVFDKTGTLTTGQLSVCGFLCDPPEKAEELCSLLYYAEKNSIHPIARAICRFTAEKAGKEPAVSDFREQDGGVEAVTPSGQLWIGNRRFVEKKLGRSLRSVLPEKTEKGTVYFAVGETEGRLELADTLREDAFEAVKSLQEQGICTSVLSGDREENSRDIAERLCIPVAEGGLLPGGKESILAEWKAGGTLAMVGDGMNDLPGLLESDIGIAMGSGCDTLQDCADIIIGSDRLQQIPELILLSRKMRRNILQNLAWAFLYNGAGLLLAAAGVLSPVTAGFAMSISSTAVILNAGRMKRIGNKIWENSR